METVLILNALAGTVAAKDGDAGPAELGQAFAATGFHPRIVVAESGRLETKVQEAVAQRPAIIFVGGGDGTVGTAAGQLAGTGIPLGVVPLGTLNHFARDLGLSTDWRQSLRTFAQAAPRAVDVGEVNGRIFINNCSLGTYAEAVRQREALRRRHGLRKWWAMTLASWHVFIHLRRMRLAIETSEGVTSLRSPFLLVSNNRYTGHVLNGAIRERMDEGQLCLHTTPARRRWTMVRLCLQALGRRLDELDHVETRSVTAATVTVAHRPPPVAVDGELVSLTFPLRFRIRPRALQVFAPPPAP